MLGKLTIDGDGTRPTVKMDGDDISRSVTGLNLEIEAGGIARATFKTVFGSLGIKSGELEIGVDSATTALLIKLGWHPPKSCPYQEELDNTE